MMDLLILLGGILRIRGRNTYSRFFGNILAYPYFSRNS